MRCLRSMAKAFCGLQMGGTRPSCNNSFRGTAGLPLGSWCQARKTTMAGSCRGPSPARSVRLDTGWPQVAPKKEVGEWLSSTQLCSASSLHMRFLPDPDVQPTCHTDIRHFPQNTLSTLNSLNSSPSPNCFSSWFLTPHTPPPPLTRPQSLVSNQGPHYLLCQSLQGPVRTALPPHLPLTLPTLHITARLSYFQFLKQADYFLLLTLC